MLNYIDIDPVYTVPDSRSHDNDLPFFLCSVVIKFWNITMDLRATLVLKLYIKFDVVTKWIRYRENGVIKAVFHWSRFARAGGANICFNFCYVFRQYAIFIAQSENNHKKLQNSLKFNLSK